MKLIKLLLFLNVFFSSSIYSNPLRLKSLCMMYCFNSFRCRLAQTRLENIRYKRSQLPKISEGWHKDWFNDTMFCIETNYLMDKYRRYDKKYFRLRSKIIKIERKNAEINNEINKLEDKKK